MEGFEPSTSSSVVRCSIQLSYIVIFPLRERKCSQKFDPNNLFGHL
jgi:hypothetical protein